MVKIECDSFDDFISDFSFNSWKDTPENREYLKENYKDLIGQEEDIIKQNINNSHDSLAFARQVNDNRWSMLVMEDETNDEMWEFYFYADVEI